MTTRLHHAVAPPGPVSRSRMTALVGFCASGALLIALRSYPLGAAAWILSAVLTLRDPDPAFRRRLGVLLGAVAVLAAAPINTGTADRHFATLGVPLFLAVAGPAVILRRADRGVIRYRFLPLRFRWTDVIYVALAIPLAWGAFELYFRWLDPWMPTRWHLPAARDLDASWRLFIGINCVGVWDELFFVNTVFAVLRSVFPFRVANAAQAVIYTSVLYRMAFAGIGPALVYAFALTQGVMFEESEGLLYVLLVHLIVDAFLLSAIFNHYYPGFTPVPF